MNQPILIFETDPLSGTPRLQPADGAAPSWNSRELRTLEEQLRARYEGLVRQGNGTIEFKGQTLEVRKKEGDTSRQPTLELWQAARSGPHRAVKASTSVSAPLPAPPAAPTDWYGCFLSQLDNLLRSEEVGRVLPAEKAMLQLVCAELKALQETTAAQELALLLFVCILRTADHLSRTRQPDLPHPYAYALSGLERLMSQTTRTPRTPWGDLPAEPNPDPAPSWLGRFWNLLQGS